MPERASEVASVGANRWNGGRFQDRVAVVTGGGRGIGRAIALALAEEGASVAVVARSSDQCEAVAEELGDRGLALPADVRDAESCRRVVAAVTTRFGCPSLLVNAAGISPVRGEAERHELSVFEAIVSVNLVGAFAMTRAAASALSERPGCVVNVASALGVAGSPLLSAYGASKAALMHLTRTLAREWAVRGVRVNAICPGYVSTDLTAKMLANEEILNSLIEQTPMRRLAAMHEVVAPALFLASDEASYVTGVALLVDGGFAA
jgi:NAD(P)-dependent dehydrogenase (short-subunit alcohol dehydrogenase family)